MVWKLKANLLGPIGPEGKRGLPGLESVATDPGVAEYIETPGTLISNALHQNLGKILYLGDSIGTGPFPDWTKHYLQRYGYASTTINESVGGNTTTVLLDRLPALLATHTPQYVVFMVSINDQRVDVVHPTETTVANVRKAVDMIRKAGAVPVIVGSGHIDPAWANNPAAWTMASAQSAVVTNRRVKAVCEAEEILYVDIFEAMFRRVGVLSDGVHPNTAGAIVWARACVDVITGRETPSTRKVLFSDAFSRPNSAATLGTDWTVEAGTWGIVDGRAYSATQADGDQATANAGTADYAVQVVTAHPANYAFGVPFRYGNSTNYYLLTVDTAGLLQMYTRIGGTFTVITSNTAVMLGNDEIVIHAEGPNLMAFVNGMPILAVTDTSFATDTRAGLRQNVSPLARFEKFAVTA